MPWSARGLRARGRFASNGAPPLATACTLTERLAPLLPEGVQAGSPQVVRRHHDAEPAVRVEVEKERLRKGRHPRRFGHVNHEHRPSGAVLLREVDGFGLQCLKDTSDDRPRLLLSHQRVEGLMGYRDGQ